MINKDHLKSDLLISDFHKSDRLNTELSLWLKDSFPFLKPSSLPQLIKIVFQKEWNSFIPDHRIKMRKNLLNDFGIPESSPHKNQILNLDNQPTHPDYNISISHCRTLGGYGYIQTPFLMGIDLEETTRVKQKHIEKILNSKEKNILNLFHQNQETLPACLWTAKESSFKALQKILSLNVISEVIISHFNYRNNDFYTFEVENIAHLSYQGKGLLYLENDIVFSIFICYDQDPQNKGKIK